MEGNALGAGVRFPTVPQPSEGDVSVSLCAV